LSFSRARSAMLYMNWVNPMFLTSYYTLLSSNKILLQFRNIYLFLWRFYVLLKLNKYLMQNFFDLIFNK
jgi:hypothetical protein